MVDAFPVVTDSSDQCPITAINATHNKQDWGWQDPVDRVGSAFVSAKRETALRNAAKGLAIIRS